MSIERNGDVSLLLKHPGHAPVLTQIAAMTIERPANIRDGPVPVVSQGPDHQRCASWSIPLIDHLLEILTLF